MYIFKNHDWTVEGDKFQLKAFKEFLEEYGWEYLDNDPIFNQEIKKGYHILASCECSDEFQLLHRKKDIHFDLSNEWEKAKMYVTEKGNNFYEGQWIWIDNNYTKYGQTTPALVAYTEQELTYGFDFLGDWTNAFNMDGSISENKFMWRATDSEVKNALWKEWTKRCNEAGYNDPKTAKLDKLPSGGLADNCGLLTSMYYPLGEGPSDSLTNENGTVYRKGNWATLKVEKKLTFAGKPVEIKSFVDDVYIICEGTKGTLTQLDKIVDHVKESARQPIFGNVALEEIENSKLGVGLLDRTKIKIGCLTGTYGQLKEIRKRAHNAKYGETNT